MQAGNTGLIIADLTNEVAKTVKHIPRTAVPDMPDRIIVATALHLGFSLLSRDRKIQLASVDTIW